MEAGSFVTTHPAQNRGAVEFWNQGKEEIE